ncbi:MAG: hypothetical protein K2M56_00025 [Muribaculaceae bacterium]|nr:hypothetical protein [Muribaculaceae bacterium]
MDCFLGNADFYSLLTEGISRRGAEGSLRLDSQQADANNDAKDAEALRFARGTIGSASEIDRL